MKLGIVRGIGLCIAVVAALSGCGGSDPTPTIQGEGKSLPSLDSAFVERDLCTAAALSEGAVQLVNDQCIRSSIAFRGAALRVTASGAGNAMTVDALLDWAETSYPQYFSPARQTTSFFSPYTYRYYPGTQNYLGVAGNDVYVLGPVTGNALARVGSMDDYVCDVLPHMCSVPGAPAAVSATAGDSVATIAFTPPASNGGNPVANFSAVCTSGSAPTVTGSAPSSPIQLTGMRNDTTYVCSVSATNRAGVGQPSAVVSVTPKAAGAVSGVPVTQRTSITLQSDSADFVGQGGSYSYTRANAMVTVTANAGLLSVSIQGDENWSGSFQLPNGISAFQAGSYSGLQRYPFNDSARGGLSWSGQGRGCNTLSGSFSVDGATYSNGSLESIILRFEQHCEGGQAALRGEVQWTARDTSNPSGPIDPPPGGLWAPSQGSVPTSGNYVYLQSDWGDFVGQGRNYTYTGRQITANASAGSLSVNVNAGSEWWSSTFKAMNGVAPVRRGYYGDLGRFPFHNPVKGGLDWSGTGRGCNTLKGWFVVDDVAYTNGTLSMLKLRFEQHCEGAVPALRGAIRWAAQDIPPVGGPVDPPPAGLWAPAGGSVPAGGNYVYLQSDWGDFIGQGRTYTYTGSQITVSGSGGGASVRVNAGYEWWSSTFQAMTGVNPLRRGYYGDLNRYPFHDQTKGGLDWSGTGRGCNTLTGWFVVDDIAYANGTLSLLKLRFEQHCEGGAAALRGQVNWSR